MPISSLEVQVAKVFTVSHGFAWGSANARGDKSDFKHDKSIKNTYPEYDKQVCPRSQSNDARAGVKKVVPVCKHDGCGPQNAQISKRTKGYCSNACATKTKKAQSTVRNIHKSSKMCIQANMDGPLVLRHIIKDISKDIDGPSFPVTVGQYGFSSTNGCGFPTDHKKERSDGNREASSTQPAAALDRASGLSPRVRRTRGARLRQLEGVGQKKFVHSDTTSPLTCDGRNQGSLPPWVILSLTNQPYARQQTRL